MQLISKYNKGIRFLLCGIDIFSKYVWILTDKKGILITNAFQKNLNEPNRKRKYGYIKPVIDQSNHECRIIK